MKRPDRLERTDFVQGEVPIGLQAEFEEIRLKNEEIADPELWTVDSLCFRYFNILHLYKTNKQVRQKRHFISQLEDFHLKACESS